MAWRDSRRNRSRLLLFISSIILGIAALVAINSFSENLQKDIAKEAKTLLGADLVIEGNHPAGDTLQPFFDSISLTQAQTISFASMVYFPKNGGTRLSQIKVLEGDYPFYGKMATTPPNAFRSFRTGKKALVEKTLMLQFNLEIGDSVRIGNESFLIDGQLNSSPGRAGVAGSVAPVVYIPMDYLEETGLVKFGSRVWYQYYFKIDEVIQEDTLSGRVKERIKHTSLNFDTVEDRQQGVKRAFNDMTTFLNLVGFIALLLGCIGVASSVHIYIKDKISTIAILRCLGAKGKYAFWIYLIQVISLGFIGGILGALLGTLMQVVLPAVLGEFLVIQDVSADISFTAIGQGILMGLFITILFALLPLLSIRRISPLRTLRASYEEDTASRDPLKWLVYLGIFSFVAGFTFLQTGEVESLFFPLGVGIAFLLLAGVAKLVTMAVRKFFPKGWSYVWRQSIANLYRPNNQTLILIVTVGLGAAMISNLFFIKDLLLKQVSFAGIGDQPNMIIFDIQSPQKDEVAALTLEHGLPLMQEVPIVTMRLEKINEETKADRLLDTISKKRSLWVFEREFRCTYRDTLIETEELIDGEWTGEVGEDGIIYVSISENITDNLRAGVGDTLTFNVQGAIIETIIGSVREVNFDRLQTNFMIVFPKGVLEPAPQFHVVVSRVDSEEQSASFQRALIDKFPNIAVIDLTQILKSVEEVLNKVSFVIRFMALFSILTGLLVLISSVVLSKFQRIQESVLLRTLGANKKQILWINALEYFMLGSLATLTGIGLSLIGSYLMAQFMFEIPFSADWLSQFGVFFSITGLTVLIGMLNSRDVVRKPPLEVLRKEV